MGDDVNRDLDTFRQPPHQFLDVCYGVMREGEVVECRHLARVDLMQSGDGLLWELAEACAAARPA